MALRFRSYFFDPAYLDRFNSRDIPTEQVFNDWAESVPFIKEVGDRSQLSRAGIAKTTTNLKVKDRDDSDAAGVSPSGFTTFVKPSQLPLLFSQDGSVTITETPRAGSNDGSGEVTDYDLSVNFPAAPVVPEDTNDILTALERTVFSLTGAICSNLAPSQTVVGAGSQLSTLLTEMLNSLQDISSQFVTLANRYCSERVALGDVVMTVVPPVEWDDSWAEPRGQLLAVGDYPELYALFGNEYGGTAPTTFALPNLSNDYYIRTKNSTAGLANVTGGSNTYSLSQVNIPLHTHTFSGTTNTDGAHTHPIPTRNSPGSADGCRNSDPADDSFNLASSGAHNHSFNGTTDAYGRDPVTPITVEPRYTGVYLKMRVK